MVGAFQGDVAQARDAVGLAEDVADLLVQGEGALVVVAGGVVVGALPGDVAQAQYGAAQGVDRMRPGFARMIRRVAVTGTDGQQSRTGRSSTFMMPG
jgi:hypothetical protein